MEQEKDTVTNEEEAVASEQEQNNEQVNEEQDSESSAPAQQQITEQVQATPTARIEDVDELGVPWKNRAMEASRKLEDMPNIIKQTVQEALSSQQKPPVYEKTHIPQLRKFAEDNPDQAAWVEMQIEDIRVRETAKVVSQTLEGYKQEQTNQQIRQQTENWVTNHPEFKGCFTTDALGNKVWNTTNPLTQIMAQVLNSPDPTTGKPIKDRPDGLAVAAELAYGRYALSMKGKSMNQVSKLQKDLRKTQKIASAQGGGSAPASAPQVSAVRKSLGNYEKSYNKKDVVDATKNFLLQSGILKEE